ncbi:hypothetical protein [Methylobacterium thuringiense]|uniref:DUF3606 domain-containing protein n=1 Tax=Methylobacterium thuringiense TaxID=1003091 RepID=A0ABQ4TPV4_9HYPH|nr:hypothetical protein [Methylobacterium thuringiense]GJE57389.1 hypothetical protein EKPJFOCH_3903 [Methylobacterium thuringiense]
MTDTPTKPERLSKLGAENVTPEEQKRRLIKAARELGASEDEAQSNRTLGKLIKRKLAVVF